MLYKFNRNYINVEDISSMSCETGTNEKYPYALRVYMKSGTDYGVAYTTEQARDEEARRIAQVHNQTCPKPVSQYEVEQIVSSQIERCRRDFRRLREQLQEVIKHG